MISRYFFLDWIGMALALLAVWQLGNRDRRGFVAFMLSNVLWIVIGVWVSSLAMALGSIDFFIKTALPAFMPDSRIALSSISS
jgi:hypothetical protein